MYLRQSTAGQVIMLGQFVDDTDFKTAETALTIANTDVKLRKEAGTAQVSKNAGGATHVANGWYHATLDATDTNTVGQLDVTVNVAGALAVGPVRCQVVEEAVYDALYAAAAPGYVASQVVASVTGAVGSVGAGGIAAASLAADTGLAPIRSNTAQAGSSSSITLDAAASATTDAYKYCAVHPTGGTGAGQGGRLIYGYNGTTKVASIHPNWTVAPDNTTTFAIRREGLADITLVLGTRASGSGGCLGIDWGNVVNQTTPVTLTNTTIGTTTNLTNLPTAPTDWVTAASLSAAGVTKVQTGLATAVALAALPTAAANATAWGSSVVGNGRTRDFFLQGGVNAIAFAADGLTWTLMSTDDVTPLQTGASDRLGGSVGGLRSMDPA